MKGATGSNCSTIIYTRQLNKKSKNCRNCNNCNVNEFDNRIYCKEFKFNVTDASNAKICSKYKNKNNIKRKSRSR